MDKKDSADTMPDTGETTTRAAGPAGEAADPAGPAAANPRPEDENTAFQKLWVLVADLVFRHAHPEVLTLSLSKGEGQLIHSEIPYNTKER